jgi:hypothetical protein
VDGADHRPLSPDLFEASQEELPEASGVLDLPEDRLHHLLSQAIAASAASSLNQAGFSPDYEPEETFEIAKRLMKNM